MMAGNVCWNCISYPARGLKLKTCSRCHCAAYCSRSCQQKHWKKEHKSDCQAAAMIVDDATADTTSSEDGFVFDFDKAPNPPRNHPLRQGMQWNHREFDEYRVSGRYVLTRQVRETFLECMAFYPAFEAPELLDRQQFEKFNYYANVREEDQLEDLPEGSVPMDYLDKPEAWFERQRAIDARLRASGLHAFCNTSVPSSDARDQKKSSKKKAKVTEANDIPTIKGYCEPLSTKEVDPSSLTLVGMGDDIRRNIADFMDVDQWQAIRFLNKSCVQWPKSPPTFNYKVIVFHVSNAFDKGVVGIAKTVQDMENAAKTMWDELGRNGEMCLQYWFLDFDDLSSGSGRSIPIMTFKDYEYYEQYSECVFGHEIAQKFLGVKIMHHSTSAIYESSWCSKEWNKRHGNPEFVVGCNLGTLKAWIGDSDFSPSVDIDLSKFHLMGYEHPLEQDSHVDIWFCSSPPATTDDHDVVFADTENKSWVLFQGNSIHLWDT